jgi:hypothetical protein
MADEEVLWPLRAVSKDPTNLTKLDADNNVLTSSTDLDARYVNVTGDTMTGNLTVERDAASGLSVNAYTNAGNATLSFRRTRGTKAAQAPLVFNDFVGRIGFNTVTSTGQLFQAGTFNCVVDESPRSTGVAVRYSFAASDGVSAAQEIVTFSAEKIVFRSPVTDLLRVSNGASGVGIDVTVDTPSGNAADQGTGIRSYVDIVTKQAIGVSVENTGKGTVRNLGLSVAALPDGPNNWAIYTQSPAKSFHLGNFGINYLDPTHNLEVGGDAMIRGTLEVTGNITSAGTAHSFAPNSIPSSAVFGNTARTISADDNDPDNAGQMTWDSSFLYLHTGATGWKKVALAAL